MRVLPQKSPYCFSPASKFEAHRPCMYTNSAEHTITHIHPPCYSTCTAPVLPCTLCSILHHDLNLKNMCASSCQKQFSTPKHAHICAHTYAHTRTTQACIQTPLFLWDIFTSLMLSNVHACTHTFEHPRTAHGCHGACPRARLVYNTCSPLAWPCLLYIICLLLA